MGNDLMRNASGCYDPTAGQALRNIIKEEKRGGRMTEANKIKHDDLLKQHEITLAKCGWLVLVWIAIPKTSGKYELRSNGEKIFETNYLFEAVEKYNELVA